MHFLCLNKNSFSITDLTKRMLAYKFVSDMLPSSAVPTAYSRISAVLLVAFIFFLLMFLTKSPIRKLRASWMTARSFRFSRHISFTSSFHCIRKALQKFFRTSTRRCFIDRFLLILLYHIVEMDILGQMWKFRAFYILIGFSGSST